MGVAHPTEIGVEPGVAAAVSRLTVVPQRRYGIWVGTAFALLLASLIIRAFASNPAFAWGTAAGYLFHPSIMRGLSNTLILTVVIMLLAIVVGTVIAIMRVSPSPVLRAFSGVYVWFFRGVPALIQLIFWFNLSLLVREISLTLPFLGTLFSVRTNDFMTPFFFRGRRAVTVRGRLHGRDHPRRHQVGAVGPGGSGKRARHALPHDPEAHHAAAGHAFRAAADRQ